LGVIFKNIKMRKKNIKTYIKKHIYTFFFLACSFVFSQNNLQIEPSVIAGCSGSLQGWSSVSLKSDFTLGQIAINSLGSEDFILTQGFHQPSLGVISIFEEKFTNISVYPNPTIDILNLEIFGFEGPYVNVQLVDLNGKIIFSDFVKTSTKKHQIITNNLNLGTYILEIIGEKEKDSFKIQKLK